jgi:hypothetical protein
MTSEIAELEKKVRKKELYNLLKNLTHSFIDALDKPFVPDYGSWYDRIKVLVEGDADLVGAILLKRPDLDGEKLSKCLLDVERSLKFLTKEKDLSRKPPHASTSEGFKEEITLFLAKMLEEKNRLLREGFFSGEGIKRFFERFLVTEYLKYEQYLHDDFASDYVICPLENFIGPQSTIDFGGGLKIRKITQDEFHSLADMQSRYEGGLTSYPEFVIYGTGNRDWVKDTVTIITALRLMKKGTVGLKSAYFGYAFPFRPWTVLEPPVETKYYKEKPESLYVSTNSESSEIVRLFSTLEIARNVRYLEVALRRCNLAYQRDTNEDRFIDYFVSLESLYSTTGERGEVTHRISTRASRVLAKSFEDRKKKRNRLKKLYGYRSGIVHGEQIRLRREYVEEVEEIVRMSLKWFTCQSDFADHKKVIDQIDLLVEPRKE